MPGEEIIARLAANLLAAPQTMESDYRQAVLDRQLLGQVLGQAQADQAIPLPGRFPGTDVPVLGTVLRGVGTFGQILQTATGQRPSAPRVPVDEYLKLAQAKSKAQGAGGIPAMVHARKQVLLNQGYPEAQALQKAIAEQDSVATQRAKAMAGIRDVAEDDQTAERLGRGRAMLGMPAPSGAMPVPSSAAPSTGTFGTDDGSFQIQLDTPLAIPNLGQSVPAGTRGTATVLADGTGFVKLDGFERSIPSAQMPPDVWKGIQAGAQMSPGATGAVPGAMAPTIPSAAPQAGAYLKGVTVSSEGPVSQSFGTNEVKTKAEALRASMGLPPTQMSPAEEALFLDKLKELEAEERDTQARIGHRYALDQNHKAQLAHGRAVRRALEALREPVPVMDKATGRQQIGPDGKPVFAPAPYTILTDNRLWARTGQDWYQYLAGLGDPRADAILMATGMAAQYNRAYADTGNAAVQEQALTILTRIPGFKDTQDSALNKIEQGVRGLDRTESELRSQVEREQQSGATTTTTTTPGTSTTSTTVPSSGMQTTPGGNRFRVVE